MHFMLLKQIEFFFISVVEDYTIQINVSLQFQKCERIYIVNRENPC